MSLHLQLMNTAVSNVTLGLISVVFQVVACQASDLVPNIADMNSAVTSGNSIGAMAGKAFGGKSGFQNNVVNPSQGKSDYQAMDPNGADPAAKSVLIAPSTQKSSFNMPLAGESGGALLQISAVPSGTSGDLSNVIISQNLTAPGTTPGQFESVVAIQPPAAGYAAVSGICGNGYVSCLSGTWNNCRYYAWSATPGSGQIAPIEKPSADLFGCACINKSCGSTLAWTNMPYLLDMLTGGVMPAVSAANPAVSFGNSQKVDDVSIAVYGSIIKKSPGKTETGQVMLTSQESIAEVSTFVSDPYKLHDKGASALSAAIKDKNDPYFRVNKAAELRGGAAFTDHACSIMKTPVITQITSQDIITPATVVGQPNTGAITSCGPKCINVLFGDPTYHSLSGASGCDLYEKSFAFNVYRPELVGSATLYNAYYNDAMQLIVGGSVFWSGPEGGDTSKAWLDPTVLPPGTTKQIVGQAEDGTITEADNCEGTGEWIEGTPQGIQAICSQGYRCDVVANPGPHDFTNLFTTPGQQEIKIRTAVGGMGHGYANIHINLNTLCSATVTTQDSCLEYETKNGNGCSLYSEIVYGLDANNGVQTKANGVLTGLTLSKADTMTSTCGDGDTTANTEPWWAKNQVWRCTSQQNFDLSDIKKRAGQIYSSQQANPNNYTDIQKQADGSWSAPIAGSVALPTALSQGSQCEQVCKVIVPATKTAVGSTVSTGQTRAGVAAQSTLASYRVCADDGGGNMACPLDAGAGETLSKDCSCAETFAEGAMMIQTMRAIGSNVICTQPKVNK